MNRSNRKWRRRVLGTVVGVLTVFLLARCNDGVHGSANASGSDRGSAGQIRLGLPF
ncbi:MAG: hypothetical protein KGL11_03245 [Alphaproteobacteria bacterium]|nr:hypothetical protein [Alphaproteobacteria bacterium]